MHVSQPASSQARRDFRESRPVSYEQSWLALQDLVDTAEWNEHNYLLAHPAPVNESVAEALAWLRGRGFIARTPGKSADAAIFVTAGGRQALARGLRTVRAEEGLGQNLHPSIEQRSRRQFLLGEYEQAVFVAMKAVEIRVRRLAGFGDEVTGVDLMSRAFRPEGPLADPSSIGGEQVGTMNLFQGAYAVLRNPAGHRDVDYDDVTEAAEAVVTASLLMRILDRVERRLSS
jgi:uncharacterized protein (TIGR02391 family)